MSSPGATVAPVTQTAAPDPHAPIEPITDDSSEVDSALGESEAESDTTSLASSVLDYKYENGRRYHSYREGKYVLPNDELEQERQDILHHVRVLALDGKLFRAPILSSPHHVLDLGTGTGIWAIDFADEFPSAQIVGTDLSPIQPSWIPPNLTFMVDDIEAEWMDDWSGTYDYIHGRDLSGSVSDWAKLYAQAFRCIKPGGWIEMQEFEVWVKSDDDTLKKAPSLIQLQTLVDEASTKLGKQMNVATEQKQKLMDAGFEDVTDDVYKVLGLVAYDLHTVNANRLGRSLSPPGRKIRSSGNWVSTPVRLSWPLANLTVSLSSHACWAGRSRRYGF